MMDFVDISSSESESESEEEVFPSSSSSPKFPNSFTPTQNPSSPKQNQAVSTPDKPQYTTKPSDQYTLLVPEIPVTSSHSEKTSSGPETNATQNTLFSKLLLPSRRQKRPSFDLSELPMNGNQHQEHSIKRVKSNTQTWKPNQCRKCGGMGHLPGVCPSIVGSHQNPSAQVCTECSGYGHDSSDCPSIVHIQTEQPKLSTTTNPLQHTITNINQSTTTAPTIPPLLQKGVPFSNPSYSNYFSQMMVAWQWQWYFWSQSSSMSMDNLYPQDQYNSKMYNRGAGIPFPAFGFHGPPQPHLYAGDETTQPPNPKYASPQDLCLRCKKPGHWAKECPDAPPRESENSCWKCGHDGHKGKNCNVCFFCGRPGHKRLKCPSYKKQLADQASANSKNNNVDTT